MTTTKQRHLIRMTPTQLAEAQHKVSVGVDQLDLGEWEEDRTVIEELDRELRPAHLMRQQHVPIDALITSDAAFWLSHEMRNAAEIAEGYRDEETAAAGRARVRRHQRAYEGLASQLDRLVADSSGIRVAFTLSQRAMDALGEAAKSALRASRLVGRSGDSLTAEAPLSAAQELLDVLRARPEVWMTGPARRLEGAILNATRQEGDS